MNRFSKMVANSMIFTNLQNRVLSDNSISMCMTLAGIEPSKTTNQLAPPPLLISTSQQAEVSLLLRNSLNKTRCKSRLLNPFSHILECPL